MHDRIITVAKHDSDKNKVLYLMTKSFRIKNNYSLYFSLEKAKQEASELFIAITRLEEENPRNNIFFNDMTEDLADKLSKYAKTVNRITYQEFDLDELHEYGFIFIDKPYLKEDKAFANLIKEFCKDTNTGFYYVDSNVFVPTRHASPKEEYSAKTIRNKIQSKLKDFAQTVLMEEPLTHAEKLADKKLNDFIKNRLVNYDQRNEPSKDYSSGMSVYLKYGFISPVTIYDSIRPIDSENKESFIEEMVVRRELAYNFVLYNRHYDEFDHITYDWAYLTMKRHLKDKREYIYTKEDYLNFSTHDEYFNSAMKEMVFLGTMQSYMRMYWCKKIIEWSKTYREAYEIALSLNNYYFLDGNTPNGYNGVAWCFGKHDRAWTERPIFGKLRYMNSNGLKRKFDIDGYVEKIEKKISERKKTHELH